MSEVHWGSRVRQNFESVEEERSIVITAGSAGRVAGDYKFEVGVLISEQPRVCSAVQCGADRGVEPKPPKFDAESTSDEMQMMSVMFYFGWWCGVGHRFLGRTLTCQSYF